MTSFDTQHTDLIHDAQIDFYGKRLATASSDRTIRIFNVDTKTLLAELRAHEGPVWQVAWAHPKHGSILASCGYDRKVIIWKETENGWQVSHIHEKHDLSVNSISWAPQEFGLNLACGSSDSHISILTYKENTWTSEKFQANKVGVSSISWSDTEPYRFASGGCDKLIYIWSLQNGKWTISETLKGHSGWVRDVAWAPNIGLPYDTIASCSQDGEIIFWRDNKENKSFAKHGSIKINEIAWRVSWSTTGNIVAVTSGDNNVTLYTELLGKDGEWKAISQMDESGSLAFSGDS